MTFLYESVILTGNDSSGQYLSGLLDHVTVIRLLIFMVCCIISLVNENHIADSDT